MSTTDPEHRLVCWLSDVEPAPATLSAAIEASRQPAFDWNRALQLAARNWVLPAIALNLLSFPRDDAPLPDEVRTSVRLAGITARTNCTTIAAHLAPVFARWNAAGLHWALMKGAALIASAYPPDARLLHDVDVLVAPEHYATARAALLAAGFAPATGVHTEEFMLAAKEQVVFSNAAVAGAASTQVDLHRETYGPAKPYRFDTGELLDRRRPVSFYGVPAYALDATDLLLHLSTQLLNDRLLVKLQRLADLGVLLRRVDAGECDHRATATSSAAGLAMARAAVGAMLAMPGEMESGNTDVDRRAMSITRTLVARGWPWASAFEAGALPEGYRRAAAGIVDDGFRGELRNTLKRGRQYRRETRASGATSMRSALGGLKQTMSGIGNVLRIGWESRLR